MVFKDTYLVLSQYHNMFFNQMYFSALEYPKIRLPRDLRTRFIRKVGEKINLTIPFQVRTIYELLDLDTLRKKLYENKDQW